MSPFGSHGTSRDHVPPDRTREKNIVSLLLQPREDARSEPSPGEERQTDPHGGMCDKAAGLSLSKEVSGTDWAAVERP